MFSTEDTAPDDSAKQYTSTRTRDVLLYGLDHCAILFGKVEENAISSTGPDDDPIPFGLHWFYLSAQQRVRPEGVLCRIATSNSLVHPFVTMIRLLHHLHLLLRKRDTSPSTSLIQRSLPIPLLAPGLSISFRDRTSSPMQ